jgi:putative ATPase
VAQQYLPSSLQGEVFWQPGPLGWEGQLRPLLQQRRAAQLAATAETALDQPERLSSAEEDPLLERWLRRQAAAEGERLDRLRRRFWQDACLGRLDRVLVLEAHSLLWALDPLQSCAEGEVVVTVPSEDERLRLEAQLQLLDQLRRPRLIQLAPNEPERLPALLAAEPDAAQRFDWIAARQPLRDSDAALRQRWLDQLSALAAEGARLRWLVSDPCLGPAGGLLELGDGPLEPPVRALLERARQLEEPWLRQRRLAAEDLERQLKGRGWQLRPSLWQERLEQPLSEALLRRWFDPEAAYRQQMGQDLSAAELDQLAAVFQQRRGGRVVQLLEHRLLEGRLLEERLNGSAGRSSRRGGERRSQKSPGRGRGG